MGDNVVNSLTGGLESLTAVAAETLTWGKGFVNKYAMWILIIIFTSVFVKGFGVKIKA